MAELSSISTLPGEFAGRNTGGKAAMDRAGKFLYAYNRGHNSIAVFTPDAGYPRP